MRDRHAVHVQDLAEVKAQRREKRAKEKIATEKSLNKSQGLLIHAIYRYNQYWSKACVKGDVRQVDRTMRSLTTPTARRRLLRTNIEMRVLGLGGEFARRFSITWSSGGSLRSVDELAKYLKLIMREERKMDADIPKEPPTMLPQRRVTPIIGAVTAKVRSLDRKYFSDVTKFREDADVMRLELETKGEYSLYSMMQPEVRPLVQDMVKENERIDVLCEMTVGEEGNTTNVLHWCQGIVKECVSEGNGTAKAPPIVMVMWDGLSHVAGWEKGGLLKQELKNYPFNKCKVGAWRLDVDIEEVRNVETLDSDDDNKTIGSQEEDAEEDNREEERDESDGESSSESGNWTSKSDDDDNEGSESDSE